MTVAKAIYAAIRARRIDHVFCLPGESFLAAMDAFYESDRPLLIPTRHEEGAGILAEAYAKATGRTGVCMVTRGPGLTHMSIALHTAQQDSTPLVAVVGQVPTRVRHREGFQETDVVAVARPMAKWAVEINRADRAAELVDKAFHIANAGRPGPVVISLPEDIDRDPDAAPSTWRVGDVLAPAPSAAGLAAAAAMIADAKRPCIVAGGGVLRAEATDALVRFAERLGAPVYTGWRRFDAFPNKHPLYLGGLPFMAPDLIEPLTKSDLIIAIGTRLGEFTTKSYSWPAPGQRLLHIDPSPEDTGGGWAGADLAIVADAGEALTALGDAIDKAPTEARKAEVAAWRAHFEARTTPRSGRTGHQDGAIDLEGIYHDILRLLGDDASTSCDAGTFGGWLMRYYRWNRPRTFYGPTAGGMGYALPAAIAAKLARPDSPAVAFAGDGGFAMTMSELETAVRLNLGGLVALVFNNNNYGTIRGHQKRVFPGRHVATDLGAIDFAGVATALGAAGFRVTQNAAFADAFQAALAAGRPAVIDIAMSRDRLSPWADDD